MLEKTSVIGIALCAAVLGAGCGDNAKLETYTGTSRVMALVDSAGAELALQSGSRVRIPEGALEEPVQIAFEELEGEGRSALPARPDGGETEQPVALTPHGTQFKRDIEVELKLPAARDGSALEAPAPADLRFLRLDDETDGEWEELEVSEIRNGRGVLRTRTFSLYELVLAPESGDRAPLAFEDAGMNGSTDVDGTRDAGTDETPPDGGNTGAVLLSYQGNFEHAAVQTSDGDATISTGTLEPPDIILSCSDSTTFFVLKVEAGSGALPELFTVGGEPVKSAEFTITGLDASMLTLPVSLPLGEGVTIDTTLTFTDDSTCRSSSVGAGTLTVHDAQLSTARGGVIDVTYSTWDQAPCNALDGQQLLSSNWVAMCPPSL